MKNKAFVLPAQVYRGPSVGGPRDGKMQYSDRVRIPVTTYRQNGPSGALVELKPLGEYVMQFGVWMWFPNPD